MTPSQRRYSQYFTDVLQGDGHGLRARQSLLSLRRAVLSNPPPKHVERERGDRGLRSPTDVERSSGDDLDSHVRRTYCAVHCRGKVVANSFLLADSANWLDTMLEFDLTRSSNSSISDGSSSQSGPSAPCVLSGDCIVAFYDADIDAKCDRKALIFSFAFHAAFVSSGMVRVTSGQLDKGPACGPLASSFFVDLALEELSVDLSSAGKTKVNSYDSMQPGWKSMLLLYGDEDDTLMEAMEAQSRNIQELDPVVVEMKAIHQATNESSQLVRQASQSKSQDLPTASQPSSGGPPPPPPPPPPDRG